MLRQVIDDSYRPEVRRAIVPLTAARLAANGVYRFAPPFLATISRGLDVDLADLGVAIAITEVAGLASPFVGHFIDRMPRRAALIGGLLGIAVGTTIAGLSTGIVMFAVGLFVLAATKVVYDVGVISWVADHVPYERRGRITGVLEMSWALGLLIGVSALGIVVAVSSWRWAYIVGALGVVAMAGLLAARLDHEDTPPARHVDVDVESTGGIATGGWSAIVAICGLMAAAQVFFVTFGPWLEDEFGFTSAGLAAVVFSIGGLELIASTMAVARTDRWGKERSVIRGTLVMVPCALLIVAFHDTLPIALVVFGLFIAAFEFALVSTIPIGAELMPASPGRGIGVLLAAGTVGRAAVVIPATRLYEHHGFGAPAALAVVFAAIAGTAMLVRDRQLHGARPAMR